LKVHNGRVSAILFVSDGIISIGEDGFINYFKLQNRQTKFRIKVCNNLLYTVCELCAFVYLIGGADGKVYKISLEESKVDVIFETNLPIWSIKLTKRSTIIVGFDNGAMREYDIQGFCIREAFDHHNQIWTIEYLQENDMIISGGEDSLIIGYDKDFNIISKFLCNRPYENVKIHNCSGLSTMQMNYLCTMGAVD
jgi:WD40 repeat protein